MLGPETSGWQPISTAPKNGTSIWVTSNFADGYIVLVRWFAQEGIWIDGYTNEVKGDRAAYWLPRAAIYTP